MKRKKFKLINKLSTFQQIMLLLKTRFTEYLLKDRFSSFLQVGDIVELQYVSPYNPDQNIGEPEIYTIEKLRILPNGNEMPTEPVIVIQVSKNEGKSTTECTIDRFKYIRHLYPDEKQIEKRINY